jgi:hypothetical protein
MKQVTLPARLLQQSHPELILLYEGMVSDRAVRFIIVFTAQSHQSVESSARPYVLSVQDDFNIMIQSIPLSPLFST